MKIFYFILFLIISKSVYSQKEKEITSEDIKKLYELLPKVNGNYEYSEVVYLDSTYKEDYLYRKSKYLFVNTIKNADLRIQYDDSEEKHLIGHGSLRIWDGHSYLFDAINEVWQLNFTLEIVSKNGKYKYRLYDFDIDSKFYFTGEKKNDNITYSNLNIDEAYNKTLTVKPKEMYRVLFSKLINNINVIILEIKDYMNNKQSLKLSDF